MTTLFADDSQTISIGLGDAFDQVILSDMAHAEMTGGTVGEFTTLDAATAEVSGGLITGPVEVYDGSFVTFRGIDWTLNGVPQVSGTVLDALSCPTCLIAGTLEDGTALSLPLQIAFGGRFTWVEPIPEPATMLLMGFGLVLLGVVSRRWRDR